MKNPTSSTAQPAAAELYRARAFIAVCPFRYATTVPEAPHEYCLRRWLSTEQRVEFDWLAALVAEHGYTGHFWGQVWLYLEPGDGCKYWMSREVFGDGLVVNRARVSAEPEQPS
jgi:hypothetical protein